MTTRLLTFAVLSAATCWGQLPLPIFQDVPTSAAYSDEVNMLRERLITQGCQASPQKFCPDYWPNGYTPYFLTRGQAATLIIRSLFSGLSVSGISGDPENFTAPETPYFTDVQWDHPQFRYIQKLKQLGITSGCTATEFCPERELSYGEFSVFVYRARKKKEMNNEGYNVLPPQACTYDLFADVLSSHPFCAYIREVYYAVGSDAISPECPYGYFCPDVAFNPYGQWVGGVRVKRGTASFYLVKGILNAAYPHMLVTSNGQLYSVSSAGPPEDCQYSGIAMVNMVLVAGSQLYGYSYTTVATYTDANFWTFVVAPTLKENGIVRYPKTPHTTAGTTGAAQVSTPLIALNPANNYEHPVAHEIASACFWGGGVSADSLPYPTVFSVDQPVLYRGMYQQVSFRGTTLAGASAPTARSASLYHTGTYTQTIVPANVISAMQFGATLGFVTPATTPAGQQVVSLLADYTAPYGSAGPAAANSALQVYVADPTPVLTSLSRYSGTQGEASISVTLYGAYFGENPRVCLNAVCSTNTQPFAVSNGVTLTKLSCTDCTGTDARISATLSISSNATVGSYALSVLSQGAGVNGFAPGPQGQTQPQSGVQTFEVVQRPQSVSQVVKYNDQIVDPLYLSTGDTTGRIITTSVVPGDILFDVTYSHTLLSNPNSTCNASLSIANGSSTGFINSPVSASASGCSGIFNVRGRANGVDSVNTSAVVVPPQILIQMLYGEANGQPRKAVDPDFVSQPAIGVAARNRFSQTGWGGVTTYQAAITPAQFMGITTGLTNGPDPELKAAAEVYSGTTTVSVLNAGCFFTPTLPGWNAIQTAYQSQTQQVPSVSNDPLCYSGPAYPNGRQFIIKTSIGLNANGPLAPAFIFVQPRPQASDPAVIQIP